MSLKFVERFAPDIVRSHHGFAPFCSQLFQVMHVVASRVDARLKTQASIDPSVSVRPVGPLVAVSNTCVFGRPQILSTDCARGLGPQANAKSDTACRRSTRSFRRTIP